MRGGDGAGVEAGLRGGVGGGGDCGVGAGTEGEVRGLGEVRAVGLPVCEK